MNPLITKLEQFTKLSDEDRRRVEDSVHDVRHFEANQDIILEDERPDSVHLLLEGWAARYKDLPRGERSIMAYLIPGDLCDIHIALLDAMDHSIGTVSPAKIAFIPRRRIEELMSGGSTLSRALLWSTLVDEAILREWLVNMGRRSAEKRLAHFICEMLVRSKAVGLTEDDSFDLLPTQEQLSETLGITPVHTNRMLQELRARNLISSDGRRITVKDLDRLMAFSDFNPNYLHQHGARARERG